MRIKKPSIKTQLIIFLAAFALFLSVKEGDKAFLITTAAAVFFTVFAEAAFVCFKDKKFSISESAVISGLIIGFILSSDEPLWIFLLAAFLAVASRHYIVSAGGHLFNPAAFGIFFVVLLFGASTQWKGTFAWQALIPAGLYFGRSVRKLAIIAGYALVTFVLFGAQALRGGYSFLSVFGYLSYFYIFIMIIEPKTTPLRVPGKLIFGGAIALLIFILTEIGVKFDAELCALLALNLYVPALNKMFQRQAA